MKKIPTADEWMERFGEWFVPIPEIGCWIWMRGKMGQYAGGYGCIYIDRVPQYAHRVSYKVLRGPIAPGLVIDHLCRRPLCVNPDHLETVPQRVNLHRGKSGPSMRPNCPQGHLFTPDNTYVWNGARLCKTCRRAAFLAFHERRKAALTIVREVR